MVVLIQCQVYSTNITLSALPIICNIIVIGIIITILIDIIIIIVIAIPIIVGIGIIIIVAIPCLWCASTFSK